MPDFQRIGDLLGNVAPKRSSVSSRLAEIWPVVAGADTAANSRPASFRAGRLIIATSSSAWAHALQLMEPQLMQRLNAVLGKELIKEMVFRTAGWSNVAQVEAAGKPARRVAPQRAGAEPELSEAEEESVRAITAAACDAELGERLGRLMRATLIRQKEEAGPW